MAGGMTYTMQDTTKLSTAEIYGATLCELGEEHKEIVGLSADLAKSTKIGLFGDKFPERFFNVGIAEQNMFGMAAGLAKAGLVPFVSTFAVFTSMRGLDQVHTDICYQNLDVKMIATHAGLSFGQAGSTHHCTEDIAIMRAMANLTVVVPADGLETAHAVRAAYARKGPVYIRINRGFDQILYDKADYGFELGKARHHAGGHRPHHHRLRLDRVEGRGSSQDPRQGGRAQGQGPQHAHHQAHRRRGHREGRQGDEADRHGGGPQHHRGSRECRRRGGGGHGQVLQLSGASGCRTASPSSVSTRTSWPTTATTRTASWRAFAR